MLFHVFRHIHRIEGHSRIEIAEKENEDDIQQFVREISREHGLGNGLHPGNR